jgi:uncharacterized protein YgiM (DUF1202 family)
MKKRPFMLLSAFLLTAAPSFADEDVTTQHEASPVSYAFQPFTGEVIGSKVRLRTQPTLEGHVVRETREGELFAVMGDDGDFYSVTPPRGTKGYVFRTFVLDGQIEGERVNVRLYPDTEAPVVARLNTGDKVTARDSDINPKWIEIDLPETSHFFLAKDYVSKKGPVELVAQMESRHHEATHLLSATFLYAQSEIQKSLPQIDYEALNNRFANIIQSYSDLPEIAERAEEAQHLMKELYLQKKIAFLESKANNVPSVVEYSQDHLDKLAELGIFIHSKTENISATEQAHLASQFAGFAATFSDENVTDKMAAWEPVEKALYHMWAAANDADTIDEFYQHEEGRSQFISGTIEAYNRPVKNLPGDFILKHKNRPVAFLYSTKVNLQDKVGKSVTIRAVKRPNNNFAYPAFFVLSAE